MAKGKPRGKGSAKASVAGQPAPGTPPAIRPEPPKSEASKTTQAVVSEDRSQVIDPDGSTTFSSDTRTLGVSTRADSSENSLTLHAQFNAHQGPLPSIGYFRDLQSIIQAGPKAIIDSFVKQSEHRRHIEKVTVESRARISERGQIFAFILILVALVGSFCLIGLGFQGAGLTAMFTALLSVVGLFIHGRESQKRERVEKEEIRERIARKEPVESIVARMPESGTP